MITLDLVINTHFFLPELHLKWGLCIILYLIFSCHDSGYRGSKTAKIVCNARCTVTPNESHFTLSKCSILYLIPVFLFKYPYIYLFFLASKHSPLRYQPPVDLSRGQGLFNNFRGFMHLSHVGLVHLEI